MKTKTINLYSYSELSERAKERAREWFRSCDDGEFSECVFEDAAEIADIIGLDICQTRTNNGTYKPTIYYSGFSSQGDGACFVGTYKYKKGALSALSKHIGGKSDSDKELLRIAKGLQDVQKQHSYKLTAETEHRGHYQHSGCMLVDVSHSDDICRDIGNAEDVIRGLLRDFANWIYRQLETEYDYQNSDETVAENIEANEYEFLESGAIA